MKLHLYKSHKTFITFSILIEKNKKQIDQREAIGQGTLLSKHCFTIYSTYMFAFVHWYFPTTQEQFFPPRLNIQKENRTK